MPATHTVSAMTLDHVLQMFNAAMDEADALRSAAMARRFQGDLAGEADLLMRAKVAEGRAAHWSATSRAHVGERRAA